MVIWNLTSLVPKSAALGQDKRTWTQALAGRKAEIMSDISKTTLETLLLNELLDLCHESVNAQQRARIGLAIKHVLEKPKLTQDETACLCAKAQAGGAPGAARRWDRVLTRRLHRAVDAGCLEAKRIGVLDVKHAPSRFVVITTSGIPGRDGCFDVFRDEVDRTLKTLKKSGRRSFTLITITDGITYAELRRHSVVDVGGARFRLSFPAVSRSPVEDRELTIDVIEAGASLTSLLAGLSLPKTSAEKPETDNRATEKLSTGSLWERHLQDSLGGLLLGGRWRIMRFVGEDHFSAIYEAWEEVRGVRCAIRVLNPTSYSIHDRERLAKSQRAIEDLAHPTIALWQLIGGNATNDDARLGPWVREDWVGARTLRQQIVESGPLPWAQALPYLWWVADALARAEEVGPNAAHGDLELDDIVLVGGEAPGVRIKRWGLSPTSESNPSDDDRTALGRIALALLTGETRALSDKKKRWRGSRVPSRLREWVNRLIDGHHNRRFSTSNQALLALRGIRMRSVKAPWLKAVAALIVLGVLVGLGYKNVDWSFLSSKGTVASGKSEAVKLSVSTRRVVLGPNSSEFKIRVDPVIASILNPRFVGRGDAALPLKDWELRYDSGEIRGNVPTGSDRIVQTHAAIELTDDEDNRYQTPILEWIWMPPGTLSLEPLSWDPSGTLSVRVLGPKSMVDRVTAKTGLGSFELSPFGDAGLWRTRIGLENRTARIVLRDIAGSTLEASIEVPMGELRSPLLSMYWDRAFVVDDKTPMRFHPKVPPTVEFETSAPASWEWALKGPGTARSQGKSKGVESRFMVPPSAWSSLAEGEGRIDVVASWPGHPEWKSVERGLEWIADPTQRTFVARTLNPREAIENGAQYSISSDSFEIEVESMGEFAPMVEAVDPSGQLLEPLIRESQGLYRVSFDFIPEGSTRITLRQSFSDEDRLLIDEAYSFNILADRTPPGLLVEVDDMPRVVRLSGDPGPWLALRVNEPGGGATTVDATVFEKGSPGRLFSTQRDQKASGFMSWPLASLAEELLKSKPKLKDGVYTTEYRVSDALSNTSEEISVDWELSREGPVIELPDVVVDGAAAWQSGAGEELYSFQVRVDDPNGVGGVSALFTTAGTNLTVRVDGTPVGNSLWLIETRFERPWIGRPLGVVIEALDSYGTRSSRRLDEWVLEAPSWDAPARLDVLFEDFDVTGMAYVVPDPSFEVGGRDSDLTESNEFGVGSFRLAARRSDLADSASLIPYYLDEYEVTRGQFMQFVLAEDGYRSRQHWPEVFPFPDVNRRNDLLKRLAGQGGLPATEIDWAEAYAYAHWVGKRLPNHAEWEYALRGGLEYRSSVQEANEEASLICLNSDETWPRWRGGDKSRFGVWQLAGNVSEWTSTPVISSAVDGTWFWVVGGSFRTSRGDFAVVRPMELYSSRDDLGFRCALDAELIRLGKSLGAGIEARPRED